VPTLWIDADACPVKAEAVAAGLRHRWRVRLVCNGGIRPSAYSGAEVVVVAEGPDVADRFIAEGCEPGDVAVTADIPLAARVIEAGGRVVKPDGEALGLRNIGPALAARDLAADLRAADPFRQGRGRAFGAADRRRFLDALERALRGA
jgi:uncharacterized protein YaiI (UPF0178 family)